MKIIIAPDSYKESLTAMEVATAIETGFRHIIPNAEYYKLPMADGGEGTVQSLVDATNGTIIQHPVTSPLGQSVMGFYGLFGDGKTAVIEMAAASGLHLVPNEQRNPLKTTSFGTGELIKAALDRKVEKIIIGIGGSATNDGGLGMLQALGVKMQDHHGNELAYGGEALADLATIDCSTIDPRLAHVQLEVACDVNNPLCGEHGASYVFGPQKGATPAMVAHLDRCLDHYANIIQQQLGVDVKDKPGAGAAGGLGAALLGFLGAELRSGIEIVMDAVQFEQKLSDADLVITGEGRIDSQTIHGKTPIGVARVAKKHQLPVIAIAGCLSNDYHVVHQHGIDAAFSVVPRSMTLADALQDARINVETSARNVASLLAINLMS